MGSIRRIRGDQDIRYDNRVDMRALGLYYKMLNLPKHWDFSIKGLATILPDGVDSIREALKRLVRFGYCKREKITVPGGGSRYEYWILIPPTLENPRLDFDTQSKNNTKGSILRTQAEADIDAWFHADEGPKTWSPREEGLTQPSLLSKSDPVKVESVIAPISKVSHTIMYRICYSTETEQQALVLTSEQRGRVASVLGKLRDAGADLNDVYKFEQWWKQSWLSKQKGTGVYNPPRPEQVLEHWFNALKSYKAFDPEPNGDKGSDIDIDTLTAKMLKRATERRGGQ